MRSLLLILMLPSVHGGCQRTSRQEGHCTVLCLNFVYLYEVTHPPCDAAVLILSGITPPTAIDDFENVTSVYPSLQRIKITGFRPTRKLCDNLQKACPISFNSYCSCSRTTSIGQTTKSLTSMTKMTTAKLHTTTPQITTPHMPTTLSSTVRLTTKTTPIVPTSTTTKRIPSTGPVSQTTSEI